MWKITGKVAATVGKLVAAALLISFLSIWTTGYVVNSYVETLLKQFHIPMEEQPFALSGLWGDMWGADPEPKDAAKTDTADSSTSSNQSATGSSNSDKDSSSADGSPNSDNSDTDTGSTGGESTGSSGTGNEDAGPSDGITGSSDESPSLNQSDNDSVDAFGDMDEGALSDIGGGTGPKGNSSAAAGQESADSSGAGTGTSNATKDETAMSTDEINAAKSQISESDKEQLFKVMNKLPQDAWQQISKLMEDGLTAEEMTQVKQLMAQHLDRSEYDAMSAILSKY